MKRRLLAHDLGTSGNKATLFSVDGELIDRFLEIEAVHTPDEAARKTYLERVPIFDGCYHALYGVYERI
ncbi:MAG: hypothetical protein HQ567_18525 [Candidatus Nealsonbacteria bacterium]|nr:hypothetical protein [Candidatus Nealsonbacteria bacterium]